MSAFAWLHRSRRPSSPPESFCSAGTGSAPDRPASSSDSFDPASAQRVLDASPGPATAGRLLRRSAAALLLALPLLGVSAPAVLAQGPELWLSPVSTAGVESDYGVICAIRNNNPSLAVNLRITQTGDFLASGHGGNKVKRGGGSVYQADLHNDNVDEPDGSVTCTLLPGTGYRVHSTRFSATKTVKDDDPTIVSLARPDSGTVVEGATAEFTVTLGRALVAGEIVDVPLAVGGTASLADWSLALKTVGNTGVTLTGQATATPKLRFSGAAAQTATLVLIATDDSAPELFETVTVALGPDGTGTNGFDRSSLGTNVGGGADPHGTNRAFTVRIRDNDRTEEVENRPVVYLQHAVSGGYETDEGDPAKAVLAVFPPQNTETVVGIMCTDGTATGSGAGADHTCPSTVTVPRWTPRLTFDIPTTADEAGEGDETFTVTITSVPAGFQVGTGRWTEAEVTIVDDEPTVTVTAGSPVTEGDDAVFTVHARPAPASDLTVNLSVTENASAFYGDFVQGTDEGTKTVTVPANATSATLTVPTDDDTTDEPAGEVTARLVRSSAYAVGGPSSASVHVADDDLGTLLAQRAPPRFVTVEFEGEGVDSIVRLPVPPGVSGNMQFVLSTAVHYPGTKGGYDCSGRPHLVDTKFEEVLIKVDGGPNYYAETQGYIVHTRNLSGRAHVDLPVRLCSGAVGKSFQVLWHRTRAFDGNAPNCTKEWGPTSALCRTTVTVVEKGSGGPFLKAQFSGQVVATPPAVTISADATQVDEGGDVTFTVTADPAPAHDLVVNVAADEEMGTGDDRVGSGHPGTVTIRAWQTSATWTVTTMSDDVRRADGTVVGRIRTGDGYTVGKPFEVAVALLDDDGVTTQSEGDSVVTDPATPGVDPALVAQVRGYAAETHEGQEHVDRWKRVLAAFGDDNGYTAMTAAEAQTHADRGWRRWVPVVAALEALEAARLTLPAVSVSAGADVTEGGDAVFTVTADPAPAAELAVTVTVAAAGEFGVTAGSRTVPISTTGSATLTLTTANDGADEADGSVSVTVAAGDGYTVGSPASGTVAIADDDQAPAVATVDPALVAQVRGYAAETHHGQEHVDRWMRVLAAFGDDNGYTAMTAAEAQTHADRGWQRWVPVVAALEALEAARQPLILPAVSVSAGADVTEGGDAVFTVTANPAPAAELSVTVTVATAGEFGVTAGSRSVTIPTAGSATLTLATTGDEVDEPDGSVSVTVAAGDGYTVGDPSSGTVAIADDDEPLPAITVSAGDAVTEGGDATFTVTASPAPASPLAVSVTVAAKGDYGIASGTQTVSIPTTGSATLTLATANDEADEPDGSVSVTVAAGDGYTVGSPASGSVSIADDDLPPPAVSIAAKAASVTEGGAAAFTLTADRAPDADLTVTLSVAETGGGDHVAAADEGPATAVIAKGATEAVFSVATVDDDANEPDGSVTVTLKDGGGYTVPSPPGNAAAVTVSDNDAAALPSLSVADVTIREGAWMEFTVRLSAPSAGGVAVKVSTRDSTPVSATARKDYWPLSGRTVSFRAGETERSVGVIVLDDSHDEEPETFEVVLSDARGAAIGDGVAVGTIVNDDPMPAAWLARFGRTVAEQALDGIAGRMSADRTPGMQGSIAGQALSFDPAANDNPGSRGAAPGHAPDGAAVPGGTGALALADVAQAFGDRSGQSGPGGFGHDAAGFGSGFDGMQPQSRGMTGREALLGSSFSLTGATDGSGGSMAFWGRAAQGSFDGREGTFSLDGTVTTGMLGADYARGKWLVGLALAQSEGEGDYRDSDVSPRPDGQICPEGAGPLCSGAVRAGDGSVEASLTAAIPYAALQASERLKLWGAAGYGTGEVTLKTALGGSYKSDTTWSMAAAGLRGDLLAPPAEGSGPALAVTSDALWTRSSSEKTDQLAASDSDATRLRLGLEGSYRMALEGGGSLVPKLEVGARHDGGDAETGSGLEIGGGIVWTDPALGLSLDVSGRTLIAHGNDDLKDRGYAASLAFDPDPATQRGPSLSLRQEFGGQARGGLDALFQPATLEDRNGSEATSRWAMEAAYGFPAFGGRWTGSPHVGLGFATGARDYVLGWRLAPEKRSAANVSFGVKATRQESAAQTPEHTVGFEITARW